MVGTVIAKARVDTRSMEAASVRFCDVRMNHLCGIDDLIKHVFGYEAQLECGFLER